MKKIMKEQQIEPKKLEIEKDFKEKLKLYFIIIRPGIYPPIPNEHVKGILAYRTEDALARAKQDEEQPGLAFIYTGNYIYVDELLKRIKTEGVTIISTPKKTVPQAIMYPPSKIGLEGFKVGLKMAAEEYLEDEKDKKKAKELINKIKKKKI